MLMLETDICCISTPQQMEWLREDPKGQYRLAADIDMDGAAWAPVDFDGILDGEGHTIRNFKIVAATAGGNQGFFGCLGENARVDHIHLRSVEIAGDPAATCIGVLAGVNLGHIASCSVGADAPYKPTRSGKRQILTGSCDPTVIRDPRKTGVCVGAVVGKNAGVVTDVRSYALLETAMQGLCGENTGSVDGLWRDASNRTELQGKTAGDMRRQIVDYMFRMGDVRWIPSKDMAFTTAYADGTNVVYAKGVPHYGLPYTQKYGPLERMNYCLGQDDYVEGWLPSYSDAGDTDPANTEPGWDIYLGNDCSGAVFWSWARCCASVSFEFTGHMIPTPENQKEFGVLPVGNYTARTWYSLDALAENDANEILEGYAKLRMADAIVMRSPAHGHTRLVFRDPVVMRDENGVIDPEMSYLPTHEQGVGKGSSGRDSTWQLGCRYTFAELLKEYLPITNKELLQGVPAPVQLWTEDLIGPMQGKVCSNYRIISTRVELVCGEEKHSSTVFATVVNKHLEDPGQGDNTARGTVTQVDLKRHHRNLGEIPQGDYDYTVSVLLGNGTSYQVCKGQCTI
ncbi:MAG: hypothetical protein IJO45_03475 [Oscillospiraceae bacterium]|nr:hypothetical protein [Oscillospiraceae bacterium]